MVAGYRVSALYEIYIFGKYIWISISQNKIKHNVYSVYLFIVLAFYFVQVTNEGSKDNTFLHFKGEIKLWHYPDQQKKHYHYAT